VADGRRLHLDVMGEGHEGPVVILEGGAGASTAAWGWIAPAVAEGATVVAYDRAGLGWSDPSPHGPEAEHVVADLRAALAARGIAGPYVLVGHSLGAHYVRAFAAAHPGEVAGLVLVDPSHENQAEVAGFASEDMGPMAAGLRIATRVGALRLYNPFAEDIHLLPPPAREQALAQQLSTSYAHRFGVEMLALDPIGARLSSLPGALGDLPMRVLIAVGGAADDEQQRMLDALAAIREDLAGLSTRGETVVLPEAGHVSIVTDPVHAERVAAAVLDVVSEVRQAPR
jgi:pimeloyl-ACP methyl ester carboxylesterase